MAIFSAIYFQCYYGNIVCPPPHAWASTVEASVGARPPPLKNYIQFCRCIESLFATFFTCWGGGGVFSMWGPFSYFSSYEGHFSLCGGRFCPYGWPCLGSPLSLQKYSLVPMTPPLTQIVK